MISFQVYSRVSVKDTERKHTHNPKLAGNNPTSILYYWLALELFGEREIDFRLYRVVRPILFVNNMVVRVLYNFLYNIIYYFIMHYDNIQ